MLSIHNVSERTFFVLLCVTGLSLVAGFAALSAISEQFGYAVKVADMPILQMVCILIVMGFVYLVAAYLIVQRGEQSHANVRLFAFIVLIGVLARVVLIPSTPLLEDDYQRYLWDGAVSAQGINPYSVAPEDASTVPALQDLVQQAGVLYERINHPAIRTIYPPGAQAFFVLAHVIQPFSLDAWRLVVLAMDGLTLGLIIILLRATGRPIVWSALYWWNPIVIKELGNSLHMEAVLMPFVVCAIVLAVRKRPLLATVAVGVASAIKIWPLALFPLVMRASAVRVRTLLVATVLLSLMVVLSLTPMVLAGLDANAGVVAYAEKWRTNSAFFTALLSAVDVSGIAETIGISANHVARGTIAAIMITTGLLAAWKRMVTPIDVLGRVTVVVGVIVLVSPAQFPWYVIWIAPFLAIVPVPGMLLLAVTMPLYYVAFFLMARGQLSVFNEVVIWWVWCPVWATLLFQGMLHGPARRGRERASLTVR